MANFINYSLFACLLLATLTSGFPDPEKQASNPRTNRAGLSIQNSKLSTARGFGKRDGFIGLPYAQQRAEQLQQPSSLLSPQSANGRLLKAEGGFDNSRISYPNSWLADEIRSSPELARLVVAKYIDENGDGELTSDELQRGNSLSY